MSDVTPLSLDQQYAALTEGTGLVRFTPRTLVEVSGPDRTSFLQNFCTNDVARLTTGTGCEAFMTTVQGKILAHACVYCHAAMLSLETAPGEAETILTHLDRYLIQEDVTLRDRSNDLSQLLVSGNQAASLLQELGAATPAALLEHRDVTIADLEVILRRVPFVAAKGFALQVATDQLAALQSALTSAGVVECTREAMEVLRVEHGFPWYGADITPANLPQEVDRNEQAISFSKGCYLGQEVVARIDALGHVNRLLVQLRFVGHEIPAPATPLLHDDQPVGAVTSAVFSLREQAPLALGYVRREFAQAGCRLASPCGDVQVLPR